MVIHQMVNIRTLKTLSHKKLARNHFLEKELNDDSEERVFVRWSNEYL